MGTCKQEDEGLPNLIPIWYIQLAPVVLTTTTGLTSSEVINCRECKNTLYEVQYIVMNVKVHSIK